MLQYSIVSVETKNGQTMCVVAELPDAPNGVDAPRLTNMAFEAIERESSFATFFTGASCTSQHPNQPVRWRGRIVNDEVLSELKGGNYNFGNPTVNWGAVDSYGLGTAGHKFLDPERFED